jgi:hypothetical protein
METLCAPNDDLEDGTNDEIRLLELLFKDVSTRFGPVLVGSQIMLPKRRFWKAEHTVPNAFSPGSTFQRFVAQIEYSHPLKVLPGESHSERFVRPSKIFVWEGYKCKFIS